MMSNNQGYPPPQMHQNKSGLAFAALVCGLLGIIGVFIPIVRYFTAVFAILAIVLGVQARKSSAPGERGLATAGMVLGIIGLSLLILVVACIATCTGAAIDIFRGLGGF